MTATNIIRRTSIDLQYNGRTDGFALQRELTEWCNRQLMTNIAAQLESVEMPGAVVKIERLEITVEVLAGNHWKETALEEISRQLQSRLHAEISKTENEMYGSKLSEHENFFQIFIHFATKGYLPWWSAFKTKAGFFSGFRQMLQTGFNAAMHETLLKLLDDEVVRKRLAYQLPHSEFLEMITHLIPRDEKEVTLLFQDIGFVTKHAGTEQERQINFLLKNAILYFVAAQEYSKLFSKVVRHFATEIVKEGWFYLFQDRVEQIQSSFLRLEVIRITGKLRNTENDVMPGEVKNNAPEQERAAVKQREIQAGSEKEKGEDIYIGDAGLVIMAAFLPAFFKNVGVYDGNKLIDQDRAVCLAQYLTGKKDAAEFECILARILCGLDLETPVDTSIQLTDEEKSEGTEVLISAISHWEMLKDTSVAGLQESFLQREGKLSRMENEWLLQVEQKSYDVLLQKLPWSISLVKLPWMKILLKTAWAC